MIQSPEEPTRLANLLVKCILEKPTEDLLRAGSYLFFPSLRD